MTPPEQPGAPEVPFALAEVLLPLVGDDRQSPVHEQSVCLRQLQGVIDYFVCELVSIAHKAGLGTFHSHHTQGALQGAPWEFCAFLLIDGVHTH
jgi:hypothetical protein